ncbi:methylecgonone reductase-like protein isoform X1 [Cinnamomum micranthum f. kanehirae]|uniref:Methylecgonone reductase-like protein isoform X1 n=1 Tax=Cinnamomum micranthum f. kanehirae TaxID=337451 RepID=A0A3S3PX15_9MAGN|nr:methylecgonone reductase-like protein isoform X1 [Cinnamomum micranthum f. kanehirae]
MGERIPEAVLNSGEKIPMIGLGSASSPVPHDLLISSFITAIETGYRHFDTAALYGSEAPLGKAIAQALQQGLVKTQDTRRALYHIQALVHRSPP